jgi:SulP family sulfate permease
MSDSDALRSEGVTDTPSIAIEEIPITNYGSISDENGLTNGETVVELNEKPQELVDDLIEVKKFEDDFKMPKCTPQKVKKYFKDKFSISAWVREYNRNHLLNDVIAGLTVGVMLVPQGMAYALVASLPPVYGLYTAITPLLVYAILGTSRQMAVGPVAIVSLLLTAGLTPFADPNSEQYVHMALATSFIVGLLSMAFGFAHIGVLANFLSHSVISGFTSASALIIGFSQAKLLFGIKLPRTDTFEDTVYELFTHLHETNLWTLLVSAVALLLLYGIQFLNRKKGWLVPGPLIVVAISTVLSFALDLEHIVHIAIVGTIPEGLPKPVFPAFSFTDFINIIPTAFSITLIGYLESLAVSEKFAEKFKYKIRANRELIALGLANFVGSFFSAYPVTGSFSRTAVNANAGAKTPLSGVFAAILVALSALFLTKVIYYIPTCILAAVIVVAVSNLFDYEIAIELWRVNKKDLFVLIVAFVATLALGVEIGIVLAVVTSLGIIVQRIAFPRVTLLAKMTGSSHTYVNMKVAPLAESYPGLMIVHIDAPIFFANAKLIKKKIMNKVNKREYVKAILLECSAISDLDAPGLHAIEQLNETLQKKNIHLLFAHLSGPARNMIKKELAAKIGLHKFFWNLNEAIEVYKARIMNNEENDFTVQDEATDYHPLTFRVQGFKAHKTSKRISVKKSGKVDSTAEKTSLLQ